MQPVKKMQPVIKTVNLAKRFSMVPVFSGVNFEVCPGEVLGIAGRSGTGKTVLAHTLGGIVPPSEGEMYIYGKKMSWPFYCRKYQIEPIHQIPELSDQLDITANVFMGNEIGRPKFRGGMLIGPQKRMDEITERILSELGFSYHSLREKVFNLTGEQKQMLAIARAMVRPAKAMIVDDITAMLSFINQQKVLSLIQIWRDEGRAVLFFSNNLDHLFAVSDSILVLGESQQVVQYKADETTREDVVASIVGTTDQHQITPLIWAMDNYYRARQKAEELRQSQVLLERDLAEQGLLNKQLIRQLNKQVIALDKANRALQDAQRRLLINREQERKYLARELHDQTIQDLLTTNYKLEAVEEGQKLPPQTIEKLLEIRQIISKMVEDLRAICGDLRPPTLDSLGLGAAITSLANEIATRSGMKISMEIDQPLTRLPEAIELSIYRIVQEVLRNAEKHSRAAHVQISLKHTSSRALLLLIRDDGVGLPDHFSLSELPNEGHFGLLGVSERVALLGGNLSIQNGDAGGLLIQAEIPHPRTKA